MWFNKVLNVSLCCLLLLGCQENTDQPLVAEASTAKQLSVQQLPVEKLAEKQTSAVIATSNATSNASSTAASLALRLLDISER